MVRARIQLTIVLVLPVLGCSEPGRSVPPLEDRTFVSTEVIESGASRTLVEGTFLDISFLPDADLRAAAGCNYFSSTYQISDGTLVLDQISMTTEVQCTPDGAAQDEWYFGFLDSGPSLFGEGDTLVLEGHGIRVEYTEYVEPNGG